MASSAGRFIWPSHRLVTGHLPDHWDYGLWGLIAGSILVDAEGYFTETLEKTNETKKAIEDLAGEIHEVKEHCDTLNWKLNAFKTEFDESTTSLRDDIKEGLRQLDWIEEEMRNKESR